MAEVVVGGLLALVAAALGAVLHGISARNAAKEQREEAQRERLRATYVDLIRAARGSREASLEWAESMATKPTSEQVRQSAKFTASASHDDFVEQYHLLSLVGDREIWERSRELRRVLDEMMEAAERGDKTLCLEDRRYARHARQNLAGVIRMKLGLQPLQRHKSLPERFRIRAEE